MSSKSSNYGVWYGKPVSFTQQSDAQDPKSPHIYMNFTDSSTSQKQAAINVQSTGSDTRLVYWLNQNWTHPITKELQSLSLGFHKATQTTSPPGLDYWRTQPALFDFSSGKVLDTGDSVEAQLDQILNKAISSQAKVYIYGESYGTGIHDIHCNQGSKPSYDNAVFEGGALIFGYSDGHYESVFLAFASQKKPTDEKTGLPLPNSETLAQLLGAPAVSGDTNDNNEAHRKKHHHKHNHHHHQDQSSN